jgi:hypothetical protein
MTPEDFKNKMIEIDKYDDTEDKHTEADGLMCEILSELGYEDGIEIFRSMYKWYA